MQGTWVWSLVLEDPICRRATKPTQHIYWACVPQWEACTPQVESSPHSLQLEKAHVQQWRPNVAKKQKQKQKKWGFGIRLLDVFSLKYLGLLRGWGSAGEPQVPVGKACHQPGGQQPSRQLKIGSSKPGSTWKSGSQLHCAQSLWVQTWLCSRGGCQRACLHAVHDSPRSVSFHILTLQARLMSVLPQGGHPLTKVYLHVTLGAHGHGGAESGAGGWVGTDQNAGLDCLISNSN